MDSDLPTIAGLSLEFSFVIMGLVLVVAGALLLRPSRHRVGQTRSVALGRLLIGFGLALEITAIVIEVFTP